MDTVPVQWLTVLPGFLEERPNVFSVIWTAEELRITRRQLSIPTHEVLVGGADLLTLRQQLPLPLQTHETPVG